MRKISLIYKVIVFFSVFVLMIVALVAGYTYFETKELMENQVRKDLTAIAEGVEGQIFMYFDKIKALNASWASDGEINGLAEKIFQTNDVAAINNFSEYIKLNKMPLEDSVVMVDFLDEDFNILASTETNRIGVGEANHIDEFGAENLQSLKYGESLIGSILIEEDEPFHPMFPVLHSVAPIFDKAHKNKLGFLMVHIDATEVHKITRGVWQEEAGALSGQKFIVDQQTAEIYLVNKDGFMITPSRFIENAVFNQKVDNVAIRTCFEKNQEFAGGYVDYMNHEVQAASMCFVDYDFVLLAEINDEEVFFELIKERNDTIIVSFAIWILGIFLVFVFARFFLKRLQSITQAADEVAKNNFDVKVDVKSADEIGVLANAFNIMIGSIRDSNAGLEEANKKLGAAYEDLEKAAISLEGKVKARTQELEEIKATLELRVHEKTIELQKRLDELEKFRKLTLGRELRMIELKEEIAMLKSQIKENGK